MGVKIEDTFSSKLTELKYPTYSLGVQGYAPFQFQGLYEYYARPLKPRWIFIGYLTGIAQRDGYFLKSEEEILKNKEFPSAIGRLVEADELDKSKPIRLETDDGYEVPLMPTKRYRLATSALVSLAHHIFVFRTSFDVTKGVKNPEQDARFMKDKKTDDVSLTLMSRYVGEIKNFENIIVDNVTAYSETPYWKSTQTSFARIIQMASTDNAKVAIIFFPDRGQAYYQKATGKKVPKGTIPYTEVALMKKFAQDQKVDFIDLSKTFVSYVDQLTEDSHIDAYPYLKVDGHPSSKGHQMIANKLAQFLQEKGEVTVP